MSEMEVTVIKEYGVVHHRNALTPAEQKTMFDEVKPKVRCVSKNPGIFHASSGEPGSPHRNATLTALGDALFSRCAEAVTAELSAEEIAAEPSLKRLGDAASGANPPSVREVTGAAYPKGATMANHSDLDRPLYTMSVAVGDACEFTVGKRTIRPKPNERSGRPVTIQMMSGDAIYFDGGGVPHEVAHIIPDTAPAYFKRNPPAGVARISVLFREAC
jgi:alkylated DNA repair dioxygenase AlkB